MTNRSNPTCPTCKTVQPPAYKHYCKVCLAKLPAPPLRTQPVPPPAEPTYRYYRPRDRSAETSNAVRRIAVFSVVAGGTVHFMDARSPINCVAGDTLNVDIEGSEDFIRTSVHTLLARNPGLRFSYYVTQAAISGDPQQDEARDFRRYIDNLTYPGFANRTRFFDY